MKKPMFGNPVPVEKKVAGVSEVQYYIYHFAVVLKTRVQELEKELRRKFKQAA